MDADDLAHPSKINQQVNLIEKKNLDLVGCNFYRMNKKEKVFERNICHYDNSIFYFIKLCNDSLFAHGSILFKRKLLLNKKYTFSYVGLGGLPFPEDYNLYINIFFKIKIGCVNSFLYFHRQHKKSFSMINGKIYNKQLAFVSSYFVKKNRKYLNQALSRLENKNNLNYRELILLLKLVYKNKIFNKSLLIIFLKNLSIYNLFKILIYYIRRKTLRFLYV